VVGKNAAPVALQVVPLRDDAVFGQDAPETGEQGPLPTRLRRSW
jgi:hypothetical protein